MRCPIMRGVCALLLRECEKLIGKLAHYLALERDVVGDPETMKNREQQQRIFGGLPKRFGPLDQLTRALGGRLGLWRCIPLDMDQWGYERDLKLDLFAA